MTTPSQPLAPGGGLDRPLPGLSPRRRGAGRALGLLGAVLLALLGLLTLLILLGEVGPAALATGFVLAFIPVPVYVALALWIDRYEPEPARLLAWAFFWGATGATFIALVVNSTGQALVGGAFGRAVAELYGASLSAPIVEEIAKAAVLYAIYRWRRQELDGVLDGIVYAAMVGLGFAFTENVLYYGRTALEGGGTLAATFFVRGILSPFAHPLFTAATGIGLGLAARRAGAPWRAAALAGLLVAMVLHGLWNTSIGLGGGLGFLSVYTGLMIPIFLGLLAIVLIASLRERTVIRRGLESEVANGVLSPADVTMLASRGHRRRARRAARAHGPGARRAVRELQRIATELAFLRRHSARRGGDEAERLAELERAYLERVRELRAAVNPVLGAGVGAAPAALPSAQPPAAWYADPYRQARLRWWDGTRWTEHTAA